jgi:hypothetical protein
MALFKVVGKRRGFLEWGRGSFVYKILSLHLACMDENEELAVVVEVGNAG